MDRHLEIERKFLVKGRRVGWRRRPSSRIVQGYFPVASKELEIRVRRKGAEHAITIKSGSGRSRLEEEIKIQPSHFRALWPLTRDARISKQRYRIPFAGRTIELDVYDGAHRGLITAEVEFKTERQSQAFQPPAWFGREITENHRYANASLARRHRIPGRTKRD